MKIIGHGVCDAIIVEMTPDEVATAAGYRSAYHMPDTTTDQRRRPRIGLVIDVIKTHRYLNSLRENEEKIRQSEGMLRALADMLHAALPTTIIPPETEQTTAEGAA